MECDKKTPAELVADLMLDPGFVLVPQDRYEELIRAETERDVMEATLSGDIKYSIDAVMKAILAARRSVMIPRVEKETLEGDGGNAE